MPVVIAWLGTAAFLGLTWGQVVLMIAMIAYGQWQASKARRAAKDAYNASLKDRLVSVATTTATRSRVYGRVRNVDGILFKAAHGPDSKYYTFVVAVAGHEIHLFERAYFNDIPLILSSDGWVQTAPYSTTTYATKQVGYDSTTVVLPSDPVPGSIKGTTWTDQDHNFYAAATVVSLVGRTVQMSAVGGGMLSYQELNSNSRARIRFYNGTPTQDLSGDLVALGIPNIRAGVHRFAGIACMLITLTYDTDAFQTGLPQFSATILGAKCLDRRTGLTAFTENPAIIADDWCQYKYGGNLAAAEIDGDILIASANACDVPHTFLATTVTGPDVIRNLPMYMCGIVCKTEADPSETLNSIVESMAGQWGWAAGRLRIKAGMYTAPVATIDETWLSDQGPREFNQGLAQNDLVNIYNPQIADSFQNFLTVPTAPIRAEAYIAADGRELPVSLTLEGVTNVVQAQHVCGVMLRHARQGFTASLPCNFLGIRLELFDTVAVNLERYGLVNKTMEVATWSFSQDGGTMLLLREISAGIFDPDAQFKLLDESPNTALPLPWVVPSITGLALTSGTETLTDASVITRTRATWDAVPSEAVTQSGKVEVAYYDMAAVVGAIEWSTVEVAGDATEAIVVGLISGHPYIFRVRARNSLGVRGSWSLQQQIIIAVPINAAEAAAAEAKRIADEALAKAAIPGPPGADGATTYFHVAYANDASGGGFNQTGGTYIGTYVDTTEADSLNPALYRWVLIKGASGSDGTNGIAGTNGVDGKTSYLHIKYSNNGGASFTTSSGEDVGAWIGTYVDFNLADSMTLSAYTWARLNAPAYRQEGTPTGTIPEGSLWLVPSTGKQWVYVGGTWYLSVGPGSVGTPEIVDNAVNNAVGSFTTASTALPNPATTTIAQATIISTGATMSIFGGCGLTFDSGGSSSSVVGNIYLELWRDSTQLMSVKAMQIAAVSNLYECTASTPPFKETPVAGTYTYYLKAKTLQPTGLYRPAAYSANNAGIVVMEQKK